MHEQAAQAQAAGGAGEGASTPDRGRCGQRGGRRGRRDRRRRRLVVTEGSDRDEHDEAGTPPARADDEPRGRGDRARRRRRVRQRAGGRAGPHLRRPRRRGRAVPRPSAAAPGGVRQLPEAGPPRADHGGRAGGTAGLPPPPRGAGRFRPRPDARPGQAGLRSLPARCRARLREAPRHAARRRARADGCAGQAVRPGDARGVDADRGMARASPWWPTCCAPATR